MKRVTKIFALLMVLALMLTAFGGCGAADQDSPPAGGDAASDGNETAGDAASGEALAGETVKIGIFVPLSGTMADKGRRIVDGITMAADEINAEGGILGGQIELLVEDDEGVPATTINVVTKLIDSDGVHAVMGSNPSSCTIAAMANINASMIPQIAANSSSPAIGGQEYVFQTIPNDAIQAAFLVTYAAEDLGIEKFAIIHPNDDYGQGGAKGALDELERLGYDTSAILVETYNPGDKDFTAQVNKIKAEEPEAIIIWGQAAEAALVISQVRQQGMTDVKFLGAGGIPGATFIELGGDYVEGTYVSNTFVKDPENSRVADWMAKFEGLYGYEADLTSAQAYDGARMLFDAIGRAASLDGTAIRDALETADWDGITGFIKFSGEHTVPDKRVYVTQLQEGEWNMVAVKED